jgi:hypothetical protein
MRKPLGFPLPRATGARVARCAGILWSRTTVARVATCTLVPLLLAPMLLAAAGSGSNQAIRLDAGEYRWWPIYVRQAPTQVNCHFEVLNGAQTVHAELVPQDQFHAFIRRKSYQKLTATGAAKNGFFSQIIPMRGNYAVVIINEKNAPTAIVSLSIETNINPTAGLVRTLPPRRRLTVILVSFAIFFVSIGWSGWRLIQAMTRGTRQGQNFDSGA